MRKPTVLLATFLAFVGLTFVFNSSANDVAWICDPANDEEPDGIFDCRVTKITVDDAAGTLLADGNFL